VPFLRRTRPFAILALLTGLAGDAPMAAPQDAVWSYQLRSVEGEGLKRVTPAQLLALSGLRAGSTVGPKDIEAARQRLLQSGFFASVGYRFRNSGYSLVVTFTVEEVAWTTPVVFDNFVDHTDAQVTTAVKRDLPLFDGVVPDQEQVLKTVAASLERLARESKDPGQVTFSLIYDKAQRVQHWRFHLDRASGPLPICSINVTGIPAEFESRIDERKAALVGMDYSRDFLLKHARESFVALLVANGVAHAMVTGVSARRESPRAGCEHGVAVTVAIETGRSPGPDGDGLRPAVQY